MSHDVTWFFDGFRTGLRRELTADGCWRHRGRLRGISTRSRLSGRLRGRLGGAPSRTAKKAVHRLKRRCLAQDYFGSNLGSSWIKLWIILALNVFWFEHVKVCWIPAHSAQSLFHGTCVTMSCSTMNIYYRYMALEFWFRSFYKKGWVNWSRNECDIVAHCVRLGTTWMRKKLWKNSSVRINSAITCFSVTSCVQWATYRLADRQWQTGNGRHTGCI